MSWFSSLIQSAGRLLPRRLHNALAALLLFGPFQLILRLVNSASRSTPTDSRHNGESNDDNLETNLDLNLVGEVELELDNDSADENEALLNSTTAATRRRARKQLRKRAAKKKKDQLNAIAMEPTENGKGAAKAAPANALPEITNRIQRINLSDVPGIVEAAPRPSVWGDENAAAGVVVRTEEPLDPVKEAEKAQHRSFMKEALDMARFALKTNETPVGCILVHNGRIIAKGMNATNVTRNGSRHAELMALTALLSHSSPDDIEDPCKDHTKNQHSDKEWGDVDPKDGHIYPYGQKLHPSPRVTSDIIQECVLYVTVEPCVMCASLLRQLRIKKVYFGAINDKFGGTGGVFRINKNSSPAPARTPTYRLRDKIRPKAPAKGQYDEQKLNSTIIIAEGTIPDANAEGDGGNVEHGYPVEGGWGRDDAVNLLRQFYVQENGRAPVPRKKEGRAARLAAMMERAGQSTEGMNLPKVSNCGENDPCSAEQSTASGVESGASTPSLPATPMLAAATDGPPMKGPVPALTGAAPTIESTMAAKPPAAKQPIIPAVPDIGFAASKTTANTAKAGGPKT